MTLFLSVAQARVFKFSDEGVGAFFKVGGISSQLGRDAFAHSSGSSTVFDDKQVTHGTLGEIGVVVTSHYFNLRLGVGGMQTAQVIAVGSNSSGTELFTVTSQTTAPTVGLGVELNLHQTERTRMFLSLAGHQSTLSVKNSYVFTTDGQTALGVTDYLEESAASVVIPELSFAYEFLSMDTTTILFELGYRQLVVNSLKYKNSATGINGEFASDADTVNNDGEVRKLDFSGIFLNLGFRFYL